MPTGRGIRSSSTWRCWWDGQSFGARQADLAWTAGHVNTTVTLPSATGGEAPLTYALALSDGSPRGTALPAALVFDAAARTLASTTALAPGSPKLRYTVDDSTGISVFQDFEVTVSAAPTISPPDLEFTAGFANSVVLDEASGGSGTLVYSVRVDDGTATGGDLPSVLSFDASSRTLSSTASLAASPASYSLFYKVTDANQASDRSPTGRRCRRSPASYSLFYKVTDANQASDSAVVRRFVADVVVDGVSGGVLRTSQSR